MRLTSFTDYGLRMLMRMAGAHDRGFSTAPLAAALGLLVLLAGWVLTLRHAVRRKTQALNSANAQLLLDKGRLEETGLLPHMNAGALSGGEVERPVDATRTAETGRSVVEDIAADGLSEVTPVEGDRELLVAVAREPLSLIHL